MQICNSSINFNVTEKLDLHILQHQYVSYSLIFLLEAINKYSCYYAGLHHFARWWSVEVA